MKRVAILIALLAASGLSQAATLQVAQFRVLPAAERTRILDASYHAISVALAFTQAETKGPTPAARQLASCLRERETTWVSDALEGYLKEFRGTPTSLGGAVTQALMWKCGVLVLEDVP